MLAFEKLKYFRSRPSCAWQSPQCASILGLFGRLLAASEAVCHSSRPAWTEAASGKGGLQCGEASADSAVTPAWLGDGDRIVFQGNPGARVDLDASLIRIPQTMDLQPERSHRLSPSRLKDDGPSHRRVCTQHLDRQ